MRLNAFDGPRARVMLGGLAPGSRVVLDTGEYEGPFVIDRPLELIGEGHAPTLWSRRGPAVIVRSPGVALSDLHIAATYDPGDIAVLIEPGANPAMSNLKIRGHIHAMSDSNAWSLPSAIDLGDVSPAQADTVFVSVRLPESTVIESEIAGVRASLELDGRGARSLLRLSLIPEHLRPHTLIHGQIAFSAAGSIRRVWVIGRIGEAGAAPPPSLLALSAGGQQWLVDRFATLGGDPAAQLIGQHPLGEARAYVARGGDGAWAIVQHAGDPQVTLLNGQRLWPGQRRPLPPHGQIQIGGQVLEARVLPQNGASLRAPAEVDLGVLVAGLPAPDIALGLENPAGADCTVHLRSTLGWLSPAQASVRLPGRGSAQIALKVTSPIERLPVGAYRHSDGLIASVGAYACAIAVRMELAMPRVLVSAEPALIDLGLVDPWASAPTRVVTISNRGVEAWAATAQACPPWELRSAPDIRCPAGAQTRIELGVDAAWLKAQAPGPAAPGDALVLEGDGQRLVVPGCLAIAEPSLKIAVAPEVNFGAQDRVELRIENHGALDWRASARTALPWLDIAPQEVLCRAGQGVRIALRLLAGAPRQHFGYHKDALVLDGQGLRFAISVRYQRTAADPTRASPFKPAEPAQAPQPAPGPQQAGGLSQLFARPAAAAPPPLSVTPPAIDFGSITRGKDSPTLIIDISNQGAAEWSGSLASSVSWLLVDGRQEIALAIPANRSQRIAIRLIPLALAANRQYAEASALRLRGPATAIDIPASVAVGAG